MSWPMGRPHTPQKVKCIGCGGEILRCSHTTEARCEPCQVKLRRRRQSGRWKKLHKEARRYRIVLHRCGYPNDEAGFREFLADLKDHPLEYRRKPEGRNACIDVAYERKARRASSTGIRAVVGA